MAWYFIKHRDKFSLLYSLKTWKMMANPIVLQMDNFTCCGVMLSHTEEYVFVTKSFRTESVTK